MASKPGSVRVYSDANAVPLQLWDVETLQEMKVYSTQTELNSACITPGKPYVRPHRSKNP